MNFTNQLLEHLMKENCIPHFRDHIWGADLADIQLLSKLNKGFRLLWYVIDIFSKYAWVIPSKDKNCISIADGFQKILDGSKRKPNKI